MKILTINPGSTSTKIAIFEDTNLLFEQVLRHSSEEITKYNKVFDQYNFRYDVIKSAVETSGYNLTEFECIVGRGGLLKPIEGGTYSVNERMLEDLKHAKLEHASNLGGILAYELAKIANCPSFIVDPVVVDELDDISRVTGHKEFEKQSIFHALNQKAVANRYAFENNTSYENINVIVAHLGGGISVGAHKQGRVIDVNNALDGDGPFSPERSGSLPVGDLLRMAFSGEKTYDEMKKMVVGRGGLMSYFGLNDCRDVKKLIEEGNKEAELVYSAMAYQVAKEIGQMAVALNGKVDAIIATGGIAYDKLFISMINERVSFIKELTVYPGEDEMLALCQGGLRVLKGETSPKVYM